MKAYHLGLIGAAIALVVIFEMLRRRRLREKYAITWVVLSVLIVLMAAFPQILETAADLTGVQVPANLLFFGASLLLLAINVQLSSEVTRLEDKVRTLAEELGLQRLRIEQLEQAGDGGQTDGQTGGYADWAGKADDPESTPGS
ncbi:DUF2304 domain-containing protein [Spirillospora sp. NPDC047279]|uniref:DUF2304 domain-containing protein n=1 Tax=Spirillospora sp. NPDC047279 TaxID=3155478 RepID=UPI0033C7569A